MGSERKFMPGMVSAPPLSAEDQANIDTIRLWYAKLQELYPGWKFTCEPYEIRVDENGNEYVIDYSTSATQ